MRILHFNETLGFAGGAEQYLYAVANELKERGHTNLLLYHSIEGRQPQTFCKAFLHCASVVSLHRPPTNTRPRRSILSGEFPHLSLQIPGRREGMSVETWIKEWNPDIVYVHRWPGMEWLEALRCQTPFFRFIHDHDLVCLRTHKFFFWTGRICQQPLGVRCLGCLPYSKKAWRAGVLLWPMALSRQKAELQAHGRFSRLFVSTPYMKEQLLKNGIPDQQVKVLPLFTEYRPKFHAQPELDTILVVGRIDRGKGLDLLLGALKLVKHPFRLIVVGVGKDLNRCRVLAQRLGLQQKVEFVGRMDRSELSEWYRRALMV
ncbi:MAG: glycosyltransferase, partial [Nitrospinae bacterium]|nr:glycosyltransferase [Nitrospinota bacterium]